MKEVNTQQAKIEKLERQLSWYQLRLDELNKIFYKEGLLVKIARKIERILKLS